MKILHLSDFHFKSTQKDVATQDLLLEKLFESIDTNEKIDFFLFTGDLVFSGTDKNDFSLAYESFLKRIGQRYSIPKPNVIICPGNHDVDRKSINEPIKNYIRAFSSMDQVSKIVEENKEDVFGLSCKPTKNWYEFETEFYKIGITKNTDKVEKLHSIHIRQYENFKIGFVTINTAWCSTGNDDKGNLFFPKTEIEKAIAELKAQNVDWRILLLHHPLADLRDFNRIAIEDLIYAEFHFMFSGHLHKREDFIRLMQNEGIFGSYAHASFTKKEDGKIGYSLLDIDLETADIILRKAIYDHDERIFITLPEIHFTFPLNQTKKDQIKILKTLRNRLADVTEKANALFVHSKVHQNGNSFCDLFVHPVLKSQPQLEAASQSSQLPRIEIKKLLNNYNYIIYGKDKTGKSSLLFKIAIELLKNFTQVGEIPFYVDLAEFRNNSATFDVVRLFSKYIEHNNQHTQKILETYKVKVLLDNFDPNQKELISKLSAFFTIYKKCNYIAVADQTLAQSFEKVDYGLNGYEKVFIHDIARHEIRELAKRWPSIQAKKRDEFVDRIVDVLKQHNMPFNFWTLSIFLWIYSGKNTLNFNNNSELLELYIDDILDRNKLASDPQNRFSYQNYKLLLAEFAHELLTKHVDTTYSVKYSELITFTESFKSKNLKRVGKTSEIVEYLLEKGILKKKDDDYITFRLNGVFEYFIAYHFIENQEFLSEMVNDDRYYLSFKNEFEIYSGFPRNQNENKEFLKKIFARTKSAFSELNDRMVGELDFRLNQNISGKELLDLSKPLIELSKNEDLIPYTTEEKDELLDSLTNNIIKDVEVQRKKVYDASVKKFDILERFLQINGRVFKNIENIQDADLINEVFDFIIDSACNLGFLLTEELEEGVDENKINELQYSSGKNVVYQMVSNFLPSVVQGFIHEAIGHINLELLILNKIDELKKNFYANQYKLFILYSLLLDIDLKKHKKIIDEMIEFSRMGIVKASILAKLMYLLLFKCFDDDSMIAFMKEKIRKINLDMNPKANMKDFDLNFEKTRKILLLKRSGVDNI